jgi:hypothetical protein
MAKYVYGKRDTKTVKSIYDRATIGEKAIWNFANSLGVNIVRVRKEKERNETIVGDTFLGYHSGKVSIYQQRGNPSKPLHFVRPTPLGKDNKGMQILEVASNLDVQEVLEALKDYQILMTGSFFGRIKLRFARFFS